MKRQETCPGSLEQVKDENVTGMFTVCPHCARNLRVREDESGNLSLPKHKHTPHSRTTEKRDSRIERLASVMPLGALHKREDS